MSVYESNLSKVLKYTNIAIFAHIPIFMVMAWFFDTQYSIAILGPILLGAGQLGVQYLLKNTKVAAILMGFTYIALSGVMIHLGKGMIEWHFHIFVAIGILSVLATPLTIVAAALTAAVHHVAFYFLLPSSIFNYEASLGIVAIHAAFVVVEAIACTFLAYRFNNVLELQEQINNEIRPLVSSIDSASKVSSQSCHQLLGNSQNNSSAITQISATATQISQMVESTKNQIERVISIMNESKTSMGESSQAIGEGERFINSLTSLVENMKDLQETSSTQLNSVVESVNTISEKTTLINDIVFQTKLLSFNASVEAARAGEHGKGFSVVAEEIGKLASTSGAAAVEINDIVNTSKEQLNNSVESVAQKLTSFQQEITDSFEFWQDINKKLTSSFYEVEKNSTEQEVSLKEISSAADQQDIGIKELSEALHNINESSSESLVQIKTVADITDKLEGESKKLNHIQSKIMKVA
ncbi:methyl-accepting chemotaxis protein [Halobacteriovorax sp. DPLXC-1]|uniref:methyl-accepting chemotaxis protein n=1 Tax=Halobacteriovorax sp. DPLXC-1 TaxID=3110771 RepID=UPI002FEFACBA